MAKDEDFLSAAEWQDLNRIFQMRHLLAHRNGIVDQEYIDKSGDTTYSVGQRLVVKETTVAQFVELLGKIGQDIRQLI